MKKNKKKREKKDQAGSNFGPAYIFKVFRAQSCLMIA